MTTAFFFLFAGFVVAAALVVVLGRNLVHSAIALIFTFFGVAALYVLLDAEFLAAVQVLLYIGGITILLLFAIMLTSRLSPRGMEIFNEQVIPGAFVSAGILVFLLYAAWQGIRPAGRDLPPALEEDVDTHPRDEPANGEHDRCVGRNAEPPKTTSATIRPAATPEAEYQVLKYSGSALLRPTNPPKVIE